MKAASDIILINKVVVSGDKDAYGQIVERYQRQIRNFLLNITAGNKTLSYELAQETFIKAYLSLHTFINKARFSTWLTRIAYNLFYDYVNKQNGNTTSIDEYSFLESEYKTDDTLLKSDIYKALETLKPNERGVITLYYLENYSIKDICKIMDMPDGTVKSHMRRAKEHLKAYLIENGYGQEGFND